MIFLGREDKYGLIDIFILFLTSLSSKASCFVARIGVSSYAGSLMPFLMSLPTPFANLGIPKDPNMSMEVSFGIRTAAFMVISPAMSLCFSPI